MPGTFHNFQRNFFAGAHGSFVIRRDVLERNDIVALTIDQDLPYTERQVGNWRPLGITVRKIIRQPSYQIIGVAPTSRRCQLGGKVRDTGQAYDSTDCRYSFDLQCA